MPDTSDDQNKGGSPKGAEPQANKDDKPAGKPKAPEGKAAGSADPASGGDDKGLASQLADYKKRVAAAEARAEKL